MQHRTRKTSGGKSYQYSIDPLTLSRLHHIQEFASEHMDAIYSTSTLVRRAVEMYSSFINSIILDTRCATGKQVFTTEAYKLNQASAGGSVPWHSNDEPSASVNDSFLTFAELMDFHLNPRLQGNDANE